MYSLTVFSSVFGDGYAELQKHAVALPIGLAFQVAGLGLWVSRTIARLRGPRAAA